MAVTYARAYDVIKKVNAVKADEDSPSPANVGLIHNVIPAKPLDEKEELHGKAAKFMGNMHNHFFPKLSLMVGWMKTLME